MCTNYHDNPCNSFQDILLKIKKSNPDGGTAGKEAGSSKSAGYFLWLSPLPGHLVVKISDVNSGYV